MNAHLTDLELEMARIGEGEPDASSHLEDCVECRERVEFFSDLASAMNQPTPDLEIPQELDEAISDLIIRKGESIREGRGKGTSTGSARGAFRWILPVAAAASIVLALGLSRIAIESGETPVPSEIAATGSDDVNGDGRVDIVDAFVLARAVENGASVDRADVDRIARAAVALKSEGGR